MSDGCSKRLKAPAKRSRHWTSFVGVAGRGRAIRGLQEEHNPDHRVRIEHNQQTLLIHLSNEDGQGWTTIAVDRATREWSVAQRQRQQDSGVAAYSQLYED